MSLLGIGWEVRDSGGQTEAAGLHGLSRRQRHLQRELRRCRWVWQLCSETMGGEEARGGRPLAGGDMRTLGMHRQRWGGGVLLTHHVRRKGANHEGKEHSTGKTEMDC